MSATPNQITKAEELAAIWDTYSNGDQFQEASEMTAELLRSLSQQPPAHGITPFNPLNAASNVDMRLPQPPAVSDDKPEPDYKAMFHRAVADVALIEEALGIPEEESGKSARYLAEAAKELRRQVFFYESMVADRDERLADLWRPIETAPRDGGVIIVRGAQNVSIGWWYGVGLNAWLPHNCEPTHWMPLPKPPIDAMQDDDIFNAGLSTSEMIGSES